MHQLFLSNAQGAGPGAPVTHPHTIRGEENKRALITPFRKKQLRLDLYREFFMLLHERISLKFLSQEFGDSRGRLLIGQRSRANSNIS